jgi:hypothetical protein
MKLGGRRLDTTVPRNLGFEMTHRAGSRLLVNSQIDVNPGLIAVMLDSIYGCQKQKNPKVIPFPSQPRKVVRAAKVEYHFVTCTCGERIKLEPGPALQTSEGIHFPVLVGLICPKCHADVRLGGTSKSSAPPGYD